MSITEGIPSSVDALHMHRHHPTARRRSAVVMAAVGGGNGHSRGGRHGAVAIVDAPHLHHLLRPFSAGNHS